MPYDSALDEKIFSKNLDTEMGRIVVSVYSYNRGPKKLQISRENKNPDGEYRFTKLGRLSKDEAVAILPMIQEALAAM